MFSCILLIAVTLGLSTTEPIDSRTRRSIGLLTYQTKPGDLPIMEALAQGSLYTDSTAYIYDSNDLRVNFDEWFHQRWPNYIEDGEADRILEEMKELTDSWQLSVSLNCNMTNEDKLIIYDDTTFIIPLGGAKILWSWLVMQSLLSSSVYPKTVLLVTGLNEAVDKPVEFRALYSYIQRYLRTYLPKMIDIKWVIFNAQGNAGISRAIGARLANTTFVMYHDADDILGYSAMELKIQVLRNHPDIDHVLAAYTGCESNTEHIDRVGEYLKNEKDDERPINKLLALDDLSRAYCQTALNVTSFQFNLQDAKDEVFNSFTNKETINLRDVTDWPQLRWMKDCNKTLEAIRSSERKYTLSEIDQKAEAESVEWFQNSCGNITIEPQYVGGCHNGWGAIKTNVFKELPFIYPTFGEDSMLTFMVSHSNHTSVCLREATGGVYVMYRRTETTPISDEIFPKGGTPSDLLEAQISPSL